MKKHNKAGAILLVAALTAGSLGSMTVYADGQKVVTLGADLTEDQKTAILKYFGIYGNASIETLTITNADEREHLASYVPIEQIGTRTYSCALVNPTSSGGIQVKTANLSWVTGNMIASTLSTAGVTNCEVLAASPFEVSGTGALTGVIMAYEEASGTTLDADKVEIATQELVTTGTIANEVGQTTATSIVNEIKIQVIEGQVVDTDEVEEIVEDVLDNSTVTIELSDEDKALLTDLANQIAQQQYNYEDVMETLQRVEENTNTNTSTTTTSDTTTNTDTNDSSIVINISNSNDSSSTSSSSSDNTNTNTSSSTSDADASADSDAESTAENEDSILNNTDISALQDLSGDDVIQTTTDETEAAETAETQAAEAETTAADDSGIVIVSEDSYSSTDDTTAETTAETAAETDAAEVADTTDTSAEAEEIAADAGASEEAAVEETAAAEATDTTSEDASSDEIIWDITTTDEADQTADDSESADITAEEEVAAEEAAVEDGTVEEAAAEDGTAEEAAVEEEAAEETQQIELSDEPVISTDALSTAAGIVTIQLPLSDLVPVSGTLTITDDATGSQIQTIDLTTDSSQVNVTDMTSDELIENGWSAENGGTEMVINVGSLYEGSFTVSFNGEVAQTYDDGQSDPIAVSQTETAYVESDDSGINVYLNINDVNSLKTGSTISAVYQNLDTEAGYTAEVTNYDDSAFGITPTDSGFDLTLYRAGTYELTVTFYDAEYAEVGSQTIAVTAIA